MIHNQILTILNRGGIEFTEYQRLAEKTWIHRGPIVPFYVQPKTVEELEYVVKSLAEEGVCYKIVGHTSNLYFRDTFQTDVVISTSRLIQYTIEDDCILCEAGVNVERLSRDCVEQGILGFEGLVGLPGTVGGAIVNNSSCFKCSLGDILVEAVVLVTNNGKATKRTLTKEDFNYSYRSSAMKRGNIGGVILTVKLRKKYTIDKVGLMRVARENITKRNITQEGKAYNLGSVFAGVKAKKNKINALGWAKAPQLLAYCVANRLFYKKSFFKRRKVSWVLSLYGFSDIVKYVSPKNINCFIWRDDGADEAFGRYCDFMKRYADYKDVEIEILS